MSNALTLVRRLSKDEDGASLVEYTVLLGLLLVAVIAVIGSVGPGSAASGRLCANLCPALPADCGRPAAPGRSKHSNAGSAPNKKPLMLVGEKRRSKRRLSASGWASFQSTV